MVFTQSGVLVSGLIKETLLYKVCRLVLTSINILNEETYNKLKKASLHVLYCPRNYC